MLTVAACSDQSAQTDPSGDSDINAAATTTSDTTSTTSTIAAHDDTTGDTTGQSPPSSEPPAGRDFGAVGPIVDAFVAERDLNGAGLVLVDREDGIVFEHYVGEFAADRASLIASSSKMITAGVLLRLADDGLLDLDAPVAEAVEWGAGNPEITPAQLVSNSSGLVGLLPNPQYLPYICQFLPDRELEECAAEAFQTSDDDV